MTRSRAYAKLNLALVVGPLRPDGKHEVATLLQEIDLFDDVALGTGDELRVAGFPDDTIVRAALSALADAAGVAPSWAVTIEKRIPVAAGLGGGSSDAAAALRQANARLHNPLADDELHRVAARVGADVPFFLLGGSALGTSDGSELAPLDLPNDYAVLVVLPHGQKKSSTGAVYDAFDRGSGALGFAERRFALEQSLAAVESARDLAALPANDLVSSPLSEELVREGAFRADVSGAGPAVYGLFERVEDAHQAADRIAGSARTWLTRPVRQAEARRA